VHPDLHHDARGRPASESIEGQREEDLNAVTISAQLILDWAGMEALALVARTMTVYLIRAADAVDGHASVA